MHPDHTQHPGHDEQHDEQTASRTPARSGRDSVRDEVMRARQHEYEKAEDAMLTQEIFGSLKLMADTKRELLIGTDRPLGALRDGTLRAADELTAQLMVPALRACGLTVSQTAAGPLTGEAMNAWTDDRAEAALQAPWLVTARGRDREALERQLDAYMRGENYSDLVTRLSMIQAGEEGYQAILAWFQQEFGPEGAQYLIERLPVAETSSIDRHDEPGRRYEDTVRIGPPLSPAQAQEQWAHAALYARAIMSGLGPWLRGKSDDFARALRPERRAEALAMRTGFQIASRGIEPSLELWDALSELVDGEQLTELPPLRRVPGAQAAQVRQLNSMQWWRRREQERGASGQGHPPAEAHNYDRASDHARAHLPRARHLVMQLRPHKQGAQDRYVCTPLDLNQVAPEETPTAPWLAAAERVAGRPLNSRTVGTLRRALRRSLRRSLRPSLHQEAPRNPDDLRGDLPRRQPGSFGAGRFGPHGFGPGHARPDRGADFNPEEERRTLGLLAALARPADQIADALATLERFPGLMWSGQPWTSTDWRALDWTLSYEAWNEQEVIKQEVIKQAAELKKTRPRPERN